MKRKALKITRYIIAGLLAVIVGVTIYKGVAASEETDRTLEHISCLLFCSDYTFCN